MEGFIYYTFYREKAQTLELMGFRGGMLMNMFDYLEWRGDLTFDVSEFNDVDNLILSQIAYVGFKGVIPEAGQSGDISLKNAADYFFQLHTEEELKKDKSFIAGAPFLMREAAKTERFGNVRLSKYEEVVDEDEEMQFAAFHAKLPDGTVYIAFKGTDDTLVGWKEDFNMSFIVPVPSQEEAVTYVNSTVTRMMGKVMFGGHSKGGNLAIYAAAYAAPRVKKKIIRVYNNDGPGFDKNIIKSNDYKQICPLIKGIVPQHSVVGMLLEHNEDYIVVESSQTGLMQHDAASWQVKGREFVKVDKLSKESMALNKALRNWINSIDIEERKHFVDTLFGLISASGAKNLSDITKDRFASANALIKSYNALDKDSRNMIRRLLMSLGGQIGRVRRRKA